MSTVQVEDLKKMYEIVKHKQCTNADMKIKAI